MGNAINRHMLPISLFTTLCGFFTVFCSNRKLKSVVQGYCCATTVFCFPSWVVFLLYKVYTMNITYPNVVFLIVDTLGIMTFSYYQVKYIKRQKNHKNIFKIIEYVDSRLESCSIKVSDLKYLIANSVYTTITFSFHTYITCRFLLRDKEELELRGNVFVGHNATYTLLVPIGLSILSQLLSLQLLYLLHMILVRLRCVRKVIEDGDKINVRRICWASRTSISIVSTSRSSDNLLEQKNYFNEIRVLSTCIHDAFTVFTNFYKHLVCYQVILSVFLGAHYILVTSTGVGIHYVIFLAFRLLELLIFPIWLRALMQSEFKTIYTVPRNYYYVRRFRFLKPEVENWIRQCMCTSMKFDCLFFEVDIELCSACLLYTSRCV